jgi:hypothetical protein
MDRIMRRKNVRAWLFTWEGEHGRQDNIALLLHPATAKGRVAHLVGLLYANEHGTFTERITHATDTDPAHHPYRASLAIRDGRECEGHFVCGGNPYLYARLVEQVTVEPGDNGSEMLRWREIDS